MLFLTALIIATAFAVCAGKALKKHSVVFYIAAAVLSIVAVGATWFGFCVDSELLTFLIGLFTRGALATALWCIVMWCGAFPNGSWVIKKLMPIRGELSITAAILTFGHNVGYGKTYFNMLFTDAQRMDTKQLVASIFTIAMLVIVIPLTVMSFPKVRRKMKPKLWKNIQRTAYLFYAMLYVHVMLLTLPLAQRGRSGYLFSVGVYSAIFIGYAYFRIRKAVIKRFSDKCKIIMNAAAVLPIAAVVLIIVVGQPEKMDIPKNDEVQQNIVTAVSESTSETTKVTLLSESCTEISSTKASETTVISEKTTETETTAVSEEDEEMPEDESSADPEESEEPPVDEESQSEPEPQYVYNNGEFSASAYGYDGEVYVTVTIQDDVITSITGYSEESDTWYYDSAASQMIPDIIASQSTSVDAYSGATYSSEAIKSAVRTAMENARK